MTGISGLIFISSPASLSPFMFGMVMSVRTRSKSFGFERKSSNASMLLVRVVTLYPKLSFKAEYLDGIDPVIDTSDL
jgi:hypothetical protein